MTDYATDALHTVLSWWPTHLPTLYSKSDGLLDVTLSPKDPGLWLQGYEIGRHG